MKFLARRQLAGTTTVGLWSRHSRRTQPQPSPLSHASRLLRPRRYPDPAWRTDIRGSLN